MVPYDVLVDPLSLPSHPVIAQREQVTDVLFDRQKVPAVTQDTEAEEVIACFSIGYIHNHFQSLFKLMYYPSIDNCTSKMNVNKKCDQVLRH